MFGKNDSKQHALKAQKCIAQGRAQRHLGCKWNMSYARCKRKSVVCSHCYLCFCPFRAINTDTDNGPRVSFCFAPFCRRLCSFALTSRDNQENRNLFSRKKKHSRIATSAERRATILISPWPNGANWMETLTNHRTKSLQITEQNHHKSPNKIVTNHRIKSL